MNLFISDVHLGTTQSQPLRLIKFLQSRQFEKIYILGDLVDLWHLSYSTKAWPDNHDETLAMLRKLSEQGTQVTWIVGNHDEFLWQLRRSMPIEMAEELEITTKLGKKAVLLHGHQFDAFEQRLTFFSHLGEKIYAAIAFLNRIYNRIAGKPINNYNILYAIKGFTKTIMKYVSSFESKVVNHAKTHSADIVICGHVHKPEINWMDNILYCNCGDWCNHCTGLVEHDNGDWEILVG